VPLLNKLVFQLFKSLLQVFEVEFLHYPLKSVCQVVSQMALVLKLDV
jgi:hypothetical protein